ncbi:hypothetical protein [Micromonospora zamorensis]|uniref:hypothetical protein n=1 Tax=Micromonospora zamorensis TaxID=709883 RepID=UPI00379EC54C
MTGVRAPATAAWSDLGRRDPGGLGEGADGPQQVTDLEVRLYVVDQVRGLMLNRQLPPPRPTCRLLVSGDRLATVAQFDRRRDPGHLHARWP